MSDLTTTTTARDHILGITDRLDSLGWIHAEPVPDPAYWADLGHEASGLLLGDIDDVDMLHAILDAADRGERRVASTIAATPAYSSLDGLVWLYRAYTVIRCAAAARIWVTAETTCVDLLGWHYCGEERAAERHLATIGRRRGLDIDATMEAAWDDTLGCWSERRVHALVPTA